MYLEKQVQKTVFYFFLTSCKHADRLCQTQNRLHKRFQTSRLSHVSFTTDMNVAPLGGPKLSLVSVESHFSEWSCQWPRACLLSSVNEEIWTDKKWSVDLRWGLLCFPTTDLVSQLLGSYRGTAGRSSARTTRCTSRGQARDLFSVSVHPFYSSRLTYNSKYTYFRTAILQCSLKMLRTP